MRKIYNKLCPKCKEKVEDMVLGELTREQLKKELAGSSTKPKRG